MKTIFGIIALSSYVWGAVILVGDGGWLRTSIGVMILIAVGFAMLKAVYEMGAES